ncbi:MAG: hypothetical protein CVV58_05110 [Tenericutes bacterium HGW-Tenericutes-3]|nr:MAG: hypothetical protein CVV58_05110 [Tenericutes bacterium HGW-Tenericutes-3]
MIRYPRGMVDTNLSTSEITFKEIKPTWTIIEKGQDIVLISYGPSLDLLRQVKKEMGVDAMIINARFIKPIDQDMMHQIAKLNVPILVYEEAANSGSLYPQILQFMAKNKYQNQMIEMSITDQVVEHGYYQDMLKAHHMDKESVIQRIKDVL